MTFIHSNFVDIVIMWSLNPQAAQSGWVLRGHNLLCLVDTAVGAFSAPQAGWHTCTWSSLPVPPACSKGTVGGWLVVPLLKNKQIQLEWACIIQQNYISPECKFWISLGIHVYFKIGLFSDHNISLSFDCIICKWIY